MRNSPVKTNWFDLNKAYNLKKENYVDVKCSVPELRRMANILGSKTPQ